jgi:hypothetical protein
VEIIVTGEFHNVFISVYFYPKGQTMTTLTFAGGQTVTQTNVSVLFGAAWGFQPHSQNYEKRLLASSCLSVRPSVRMEQHGFHWTDFHNISYFIIFSKIR